MKSGRSHLIFAKEQEKHGKVMRIGPNEVMVYDSEAMSHINSVRSAYPRGAWYASMRFDPWDHSVLSEPDTAQHDKKKARIAAAYAGRGNMDLEKDVDSQVAIMADIIRNSYLSGRDSRMLNFSRLIKFFQVDLITLIGVGEPWGNLTTDTDRFDFISFVSDFVPFLHSFPMIPLLRAIFSSKAYIALAGPKPTDTKGLGGFLGLLDYLVTKRFNDGLNKERDHASLLDEWIDRGLTPRDCQVELAIQIPAGAETTTAGMQGIFLHLLSAPHAYQKLKGEISEAIQQGRISNPVTYEEAKQLPYLQAVISEGLRTTPPALNGFPKQVPPGGDTVCGRFIPGGTDIFLNIWSMVRSKEVFGEDADFFRPERFLECEPGEKAKLLRTVDLIFGYGRWSCLGKQIALIELNKVIVQLLREFDFQIVNPGASWHCKGYVTFQIEEFWVRVTDGNLNV